MSDEIDEVKEVVKERLKSPFYGSWAIAFVAVNWRALYVLLFPGEMGVTDRLNWVDGNLYPSFWVDHVPKLIVLPLIFACIAVSAVPWLLLWLDGPRHRATVFQQNRRKRIEEFESGKLKEIAVLQGQLNEVQRERSEEFHEYHRQIAKLLVKGHGEALTLLRKLTVVHKVDKHSHGEANLLEDLGLVIGDREGYRITEAGTLVAQLTDVAAYSTR